MIAALSTRFGGAGTGLRAHAAAPSRITVPRVLLIVATVSIALFGLLMIYSSSSIIGLTSEECGHNPAYYLIRQAAFVVVGVGAASFLAFFDYHRWSGALLTAVSVAVVLMLAAVFFVGKDAYGATRWIPVGQFQLQPSEFAKVALVLIGANFFTEYFKDHVYASNLDALKSFGLRIALPLVLILRQPDKGTTGVIVASFIVMAYLSGVSGRLIVGTIVLGGLGALAYFFFSSDYAQQRILMVFDPFQDPFDKGYQLVQSLYAFGSGGLTGVGVGFSHQKYHYLPMAHNDFIFAVIGEELGLVGTVGLLAAFALLLWAGLKVAENAPDHTGRLIAAGCTSLLTVQLLLNVAGVTSVFPLSGKPVPFVSYGGSSVISCFMLVGLVLSVSLRSTLPETSHDERRRSLQIAEGDSHDSSSGGDPDVGEVIPRSRRLQLGSARGIATATAASREWRVIRGGMSRTRDPEGESGRSATNDARRRGPDRAHSREGRITIDAQGRRRLDLGPTPTERLRGLRRDDK